jgi:hypothetical protein
MRLLIAAGADAPKSVEVPRGISILVGNASEVVVMSPSLVGRLDWLTGDVDEARQIADDRLQTAVELLASSIDAPVEGVRGDEVLTTALDDALRDFPADHLLVVVSAANQKVWERQGVLDHVLEHHRLPVTIFRSGS